MKHFLLSLFFLFPLTALSVKAQAAGDTLTLAFTGDIMMGTTFPSVQLPANEGKDLFAHAAPLLRRAHLAAGNLEGTLCDGGTCTKRLSGKSFAFRTPTSYAPLLSAAGYDFMSMANNHANDFGAEGIASTIRCLDEQKIAHAGIKGQPACAIIERGGVKYGLCAFGHNAYTLRHQDLDTVRTIITQLTTACDVVIVSFHGGAEGTAHCRLPQGREIFLGEDRGTLRQFAHFCIDAGADIVYGHGPHVVRAVELYKEHFIAYSLGNFCTPYGMSLSSTLGYAPLLELQVTRDGRFIGGTIHSLVQQRGIGPRLDAQHRAAREISRLTQLDVPGTPLIIGEDGVIKRRVKD